MILALSCSFPLVSDGQQPASEKDAGDSATDKATPPEKKDAPASQEEREPRGEKGLITIRARPHFPVSKSLKCGVKVNDRLLEFIETPHLQVSALEFPKEEQERDFLAEETKEIGIEQLLTEKPVKEAELKKLVTELFDIVQKRLRVHTVDRDLEATELKLRN